MTREEIERLKYYFERFLQENFEDSSFFFRMGEIIFLAFIVWLEE